MLSPQYAIDPIDGARANTGSRAYLTPRRSQMAALARLAVPPVVHVIALVAAHALHRQQRAAIDRLDVAGIAVDLGVTAVQLEARLPVVIEDPDLPVARVVTQLALRAQPQVMGL